MYKNFIPFSRDMLFYYAGFNVSTLFSNDGDITYIVDSFTEVPFPGITDFQIGWSYFLVWKGQQLYISKKPGDSGNDTDSSVQPIQIPEKPLDRYIHGVRIIKNAYISIERLYSCIVASTPRSAKIM